METPAVLKFILYCDIGVSFIVLSIWGSPSNVPHDNVVQYYTRGRRLISFIFYFYFHSFSPLPLKQKVRPRAHSKFFGMYVGNLLKKYVELFGEEKHREETCTCKNKHCKAIKWVCSFQSARDPSGNSNPNPLAVSEGLYPTMGRK